MARRYLFLLLGFLITSISFAADPVRRVIRENIEWLDVWVPGNNNHEMPKVLLIGDSITRGYFKEVEDRLKGQFVVCRLTTSKSVGDPGLIAEVNLVLSQSHFDVVHFNNGLHGWDYTEEEYAKALPELVTAIRKGAPGAKLIWASTTPVRVADKLETISEKTERVQARNAIAAKLMATEKMVVNDLFSLLADKSEWYSRDGVHLNAKGTTALGTQVAEMLKPKSLFDGKTFTGWEGDTEKTWRIEDGAIVAGSLTVQVPRNDFLTYQSEFENFELRTKYKLEGTEGFVNGGIQIRSRRIPKDHEMIGYQADLGKGFDGALYDESRRKKVLAQPSKEVLEKALKKEDWNDYRIRCEGKRIQLWLNGIQTVDYTEPDQTLVQKGLIGLQIHGNCKAIVRYKDITIMELPATKE